jgi:hypothetical protein
MAAGFSARAVVVGRSGNRGKDPASNNADVSSIPLRFRTAGFPQYDWRAGGGTTPRLPSIGRSKGTRRRPVNGQRFRPSYRPDRVHPGQATRPPDPITLRRVSHLLAVAQPLLGEKITTRWLARTLVRVDGGPMLDAPRLGPALRTLGFRPVRRRHGPIGPGPGLFQALQLRAVVGLTDPSLVAT